MTGVPIKKTLEDFNFSFQPSMDKRQIDELATMRDSHTKRPKRTACAVRFGCEEKKKNEKKMVYKQGAQSHLYKGRGTGRSMAGK